MWFLLLLAGKGKSEIFIVSKRQCLNREILVSIDLAGPKNTAKYGEFGQSYCAWPGRWMEMGYCVQFVFVESGDQLVGCPTIWLGLVRVSISVKFKDSG